MPRDESTILATVTHLTEAIWNLSLIKEFEGEIHEIKWELLQYPHITKI